MPVEAAYEMCMAAMDQIGSVITKKKNPFRLVGHTRLKGLNYATLTVVIESGLGETSSVITVSASAPEGTAGPVTALVGLSPRHDHAAQGVTRFIDALRHPKP